MKVDSLWYEATMSDRRTAVGTLRRCPNCGEVKVLSNPCGFDHLAAVLEFRDHKVPPTPPASETGAGEARGEGE